MALIDFSYVIVHRGLVNIRKLVGLTLDPYPQLKELRTALRQADADNTITARDEMLSQLEHGKSIE